MAASAWFTSALDNSPSSKYASKLLTCGYASYRLIHSSYWDYYLDSIFRMPPQWELLFSSAQPLPVFHGFASLPQPPFAAIFLILLFAPLTVLFCVV